MQWYPHCRNPYKTDWYPHGMKQIAIPIGIPYQLYPHCRNPYKTDCLVPSFPWYPPKGIPLGNPPAAATKRHPHCRPDHKHGRPCHPQPPEGWLLEIIAVFS